MIVSALADYADAYDKRFGPDGRKLCDDNFVGPAWLKMLSAANQLLSADVGGLDGGCASAIILALADNNGFEDNEL